MERTDNMAIKASCPSCQKSYTVADTQVGKKVRCKDCAYVFEVHPDDEPAVPDHPKESRLTGTPRKRTDPDDRADEDEDRPRKKSARNLDDEADRPRRRREREDEDEDDRPKQKRPSRKDDPDEDEDEDDRPSRRAKKQRGKKGANLLLLVGLPVGCGGLLLLGGAITLLIVFWPFGNPHEKAIKDTIAQMNALSEALESVQDASSAKAAAPRVERAATRLEEVAKRAKDLPKLPKEEDERLKKKYEEPLNKAITRLLAASLQAAMKCGQEPTFLAAMKKVSMGGRKR
jgi:predicted Zn finger-like uncharacterized protein